MRRAFTFVVLSVSTSLCRVATIAFDRDRALRVQVAGWRDNTELRPAGESPTVNR